MNIRYIFCHYYMSNVNTQKLFAVYIDGLLIRLEETGVGCHMGIRFIGALAFADDLNLLTPTLSG